ncbi:hypothetical protein ACCO45_001973 [Purpureocillium lilacinum]|uniref:Uncharacterized protein n=1 Tax=Purpureocillium lilacinum TaxID=33203 RepID=A0ACC4E8K8_PURLI
MRATTPDTTQLAGGTQHCGGGGGCRARLPWWMEAHSQTACDPRVAVGWHYGTGSKPGSFGLLPSGAMQCMQRDAPPKTDTTLGAVRATAQCLAASPGAVARSVAELWIGFPARKDAQSTLPVQYCVLRDRCPAAQTPGEPEFRHLQISPSGGSPPAAADWAHHCRPSPPPGQHAMPCHATPAIRAVNNLPTYPARRLGCQFVGGTRPEARPGTPPGHSASPVGSGSTRRDPFPAPTFWFFA